MKIAAEMIEDDEPDVVIVINHPGGMCAPPVDRDGCFDVMPRLLTAGNRVAVWWKDRDGVLQRRPFIGTR